MTWQLAICEDIFYLTYWFACFHVTRAHEILAITKLVIYWAPYNERADPDQSRSMWTTEIQIKSSRHTVDLDPHLNCMLRRCIATFSTS